MENLAVLTTLKMRERHAYEAQFKLKVISYAEEHGNRAAARHFNINESMVRKWRKMENELRLVKKTQLSLRGNKARWPELEAQLEQWIIEQRTSGRSISMVTIRLKAETLAQEMKIKHFQGGLSWCFRFMRRCHLSIRTRTIVDQRMNLKSVLSRLEKFAPSSLAEGWDNVGLLIQPGNTEKQIKNVMLTNDLTENVLKEAVEQKADMIISYHPPIFKPLLRITQSTWKERITGVCLENEIALYSPHTAYDKIVGGVNDWLIGPYGPILPVPISPDRTQTTLVISKIPKEKYSSLKSLMIGLSLDVTEIASNSIQLCFAEGKLVDVIKNIQDYDYKITKHMSIETGASNVGAGRFSKLKQTITLEKAVELTKSHLGLTHVRLAIASGRTKDSSVKSVAVCAGSGSSVLSAAPYADLWVTGEMSHHEVLDAVHKGKSIILCEHSNTERGYLSNLVKQFKDDLFKDEKEISFFVSKMDKDPLEIV